MAQTLKAFGKKFFQLVEAHETIVIFHHINPDGDCLGSQFGLKTWLKKLYPTKQIHVVGNNENLFSWLNWDFSDPETIALDQALAIVVDANYSNRIQNLQLLQQIPTKIRIDHHPEADDLDYQLRFVDSSYCASAEQISDLIFQTQRTTLDATIATYLYLGIYTDSGRFFYDKTSSRTHNLCAYLFSSGFDFNNLHQQLTKRSIQELAFIQDVYKHYKTADQVIYYYLSQAKIKQLNLASQNANRVDLLANIDDYQVWIFFIENPDGSIRVRLRSSTKNVQQLAQQYGGGGHLKASGATLKNKGQIKELVAQATKL